MKMSMKMKWLIWKDYRVNRLVFIVALVLLAAPHAFAGVGVIHEMYHAPDRWEAAPLFAISSICDLAILQVVFALLGGNSIAGERIDRSAEFLASMPVSHARHLVVSKLFVVLAAVPLVWLPNLLILGIASAFARASFVPLNFSDISEPLGNIAITGLTFFCVAWSFSCILESPTFSVCAGLLVPLLVAMGIGMTVSYLELPLKHTDFLAWYCGLCLGISAVAFPAGTIYYLRRVEP